MQKQFWKIFEKGRQFFIDGDYDSCEKYLTQAIHYNNLEPELFQMLATIYYDKGQFKRAIQTFKRALEIDPNYTDASVGLSIVLNDIGRYEEAQKVFEEAKLLLNQKKTELNPWLRKQLGDKHKDLAQIYYNNKFYEEAIEQLDKAKDFLEDEDVYLLIAECYKQLDQADRAIRELQLAARHHPRMAEARVQLGILLFETNRVADAVNQWEHVLLENPNHTRAKDLLINAQAASLHELR